MPSGVRNAHLLNSSFHIYLHLPQGMEMLNFVFLSSSLLKFTREVDIDEKLPVA